MSDSDTLAGAQEILGYQFQEPENLQIALTHASIADHRLNSNERLEFLGDAILGMVVCEELYRRFPEWREGDLTKLKSTVVSRRTCAEISDETGLADLLLLGNGIDRQRELPLSVRAAVYESIIGAMHIDGGLPAVRPFILRTVAGHIDRYSKSQTQGNYKSALQQYAQRCLNATPRYETLDEQGPDHSKCFEVAVAMAGTRYPSAWGPNKKDAEQDAAKLALAILQEEHGNTETSGS